MRLNNDPEEEEEPKNTEPRRRLELGKAEPEEPKTAGRTTRRSTRNHQQNQGSPERKAQDGHPLDLSVGLSVDRRQPAECLSHTLSPPSGGGGLD